MLGRHPNEYLIPTERRVIRVRRHWASQLRVLAETFVVVLVAFVLSQLITGDDLWVLQSVLWYLAVAAVLRLAWNVLEWWVEQIVMTDERFLITSGIIVTKISMMPIKKVTDMSYMRSFGGRLLGYGTLRVESAGQQQALEWIYFLPKPEATFDAISELIFNSKDQARPRRRPVPPPPPRKRWSRTPAR